jgi:hypothetical protein
MNKLIPLALVATITTIAVVPATVFAAEATQNVQAVTATGNGSVSVSTGKMLYAANGQRIASIYRVTSAGVAQVILNGKLVSVPTATLSEVDGKIVTSLSKADLARSR